MMSNTYNIYKVNKGKFDYLIQKLNAVGLKQQKTIPSENYSMTFFFSEDVPGNDVWWWDAYRDFFNDGVPEPKNFFYFGVLICMGIENPETIYAVSLGKSHFYLSKFIELDFGINLAVRMADENTILLKKSRYFSGSKRQDISSYQNFIKNSYEAGESVEHLKLKATNRDVWGDRNIIFADSIQMDSEIAPIQLDEVFAQIEFCMADDEVIRLPKLEPVSDEEVIDLLDNMLLASLKDNGAHISIDEFQVYGVNICFNFHDYKYKISSRAGEHAGGHRRDVDGALEISDIQGFLLENDDVDDVNLIRIQFKSEDSAPFTKGLKEVVDFHVEHESFNYFLKGGEWYKFNQVFVGYLKDSLNNIEVVQMEDLSEEDYLAWKLEKKDKIDRGEEVENKITYREYYFNEKQSREGGYVLLDRQLTQMQALQEGNKNYKIEIADLYKDGEVISVKISEENHELIYNIEQSMVSMELIKQGVIDFEHDLQVAALWFVFEGDVQRIADHNSIQFLLAVEAWKKRVVFHKLKPKIYISKHVLP